MLIGCNKSSVNIYVSESAIPDKPGDELWFNNIPEAFEQVRLLNHHNVEIHIMEGDYYLDEPISISPELNNLKISGSGTDKVRIKGSTILDVDWKKYNDNIWVTEIKGIDEFDQLYINDTLQILARYPNYDKDGGHWNGHAADAIDADRISFWENPKGAIVHAMHNGEWGGFHYEVEGIDQNGNLELNGGHQNNRPSSMHSTYRMVENVFEELDSPGEWFYNKEEKLLYLWPKNINDLNAAKFEVPTQKNLVNIIGTEDKPVENILIKGIKFEHTQRTLMEHYEPLLRSDWTIYRGGVIFIEGTKNISITHSELTNFGGNAIFISGYNRNTQVKNNHIHNGGASAVSMVGFPTSVRSPSFQYGEFVSLKNMDTLRGPKTNDYPSLATIDNNLIHDIGRIEKQSAGVQIAMASKIKISNNSIYNVPRAGINVGDGTWGGHIVEYNDVFNTVLESSDHGAFNSWGRDRFWHPNRKVMDSITAQYPQMPYWDAIHTTIIRNNRFRCDHGWDIDLDDGSSNYHIYNNVCLSGGIKLREGFYRKVENNITINNGFHPHVWFQNSGDIFRRNIVFTEHKDIRLQGWGKEVDFNLFPDELALNEVRKNNTDINSIHGDASFVNPEKGNYNLNSNSAAFQLGFIPFETNNTFGVKDEKLKSLTEVPRFPIQYFSSKPPKSLEIEWLGAKIKNIETLEERSASGLNDTSGVLILTIDEKATLKNPDVQQGDVIIWSEGIQVKSIQDLMKSYQNHNWKGKLNMKIIRNQKERDVVIYTK